MLAVVMITVLFLLLIIGTVVVMVGLYAIEADISSETDKKKKK